MPGPPPHAPAWGLRRRRGLSDEYRTGTEDGAWAVWRWVDGTWLRVPGTWDSELEAAAYVAYAQAAEA